jgi:hypothetical protein
MRTLTPDPRSLIPDKLVGGSAEDRNEILRLHDAYLDVNARFDWENLQPLFSPAPEATYFNLNGHTYNGRAHLTKLWKFYGANVQSSYWAPYDIGGAVTGDLAVVWCHRKTRRQWTGKELPPPQPPLRRQRIRFPLDHGVPQGGRAMARDPRTFLARRFRCTPGRRVISSIAMNRHRPRERAIQ